MQRNSTRQEETTELEHIFSYAVTLAEPEVVGPVPGGVRANLYATGGEVTGLRA